MVVQCHFQNQPQGDLYFQRFRRTFKSTTFKPVLSFSKVWQATSTSISQSHTTSCFASRTSKGVVEAIAEAPGDYSRLIPQSREETVNQAAKAVQLQLNQLNPGKSFKKRAQAKVAIEISLGNTSAPSVSELVRDLLLQLEENSRQQIAVGFGDVEAALVASDLIENEVIAITEPLASAARSRYLLVISSAQDESLYSLLKQWRGAAVLLLEVDRNSISHTQSQIRRQFETIYSFEPIAIKGLIRTVGGLILKQPLDGKIVTSPWHVFKKDWGGYKCIARQQRRPNAADIELAIYNASAAESPITKGIKAIRSMQMKPKK